MFLEKVSRKPPVRGGILACAGLIDRCWDGRMQRHLLGRNQKTCWIFLPLFKLDEISNSPNTLVKLVRIEHKCTPFSMTPSYARSATFGSGLNPHIRDTVVMHTIRCVLTTRPIGTWLLERVLRRRHYLLTYVPHGMFAPSPSNMC